MMTPTRPLAVALVDDNDLSVAGLTALLAPYAERVRLVDVRIALAAPSDLDVVLHEPLGCSASSARLRDDLLRGGARPVVFTWAPPRELTDLAETVLSKSMTAAQVVRALEDLVAGRAPQAPRFSTSAPAPLPSAATTSSPATSTMAPGDGDNPGIQDRYGLSTREVEVLTLITCGLTNDEVATELGLSINSIKTYVRTSYRKIGVNRRTQAVAWGLAHRLTRETLLLTG